MAKAKSTTTNKAGPAQVEIASGAKWVPGKADPRKLLDHPNNAHGRNGDGLVASAKEDGIREPILVSYDGKTILSGHRRKDAAIKAGLTEVPIMTAVEPMSKVRELGVLIRSGVERQGLTAGDNARYAWDVAKEIEARTGKQPPASEVARVMAVSDTDEVKETSVSTWLGLARGLTPEAREAWFKGEIRQRAVQEINTAGAVAEATVKANGGSEKEAKEARAAAVTAAVKAKKTPPPTEHVDVKITRKPDEVQETFAAIIGGITDGSLTGKGWTQCATLLAYLVGATDDYEVILTPSDVQRALAAKYGGTSKSDQRARELLLIPNEVVKVAELQAKLKQAEGAANKANAEAKEADDAD